MSDRIIRVPPGSRASQCNGKALGGSCDQVIYWIREYDRLTRQTKSTPVDCDGEGFQRPSEAADDSQLDLLAAKVEVRDGLGVSHALSCPDRALIARRYAEIRERQRA